MKRTRVVLPSHGSRFLLFAGLLVFALEFFALSWIAVSGNQDDEHIVAVLQGNPLSVTQSYVQGFLSRAIWFGILPTALGMGLFIASFVLRRKALRSGSWNVLLLLGGAFVLYMGTSLFQSAQEYIRVTNGDYIARSLKTIYSARESLSIFWILAGAVIMIPSLAFLAHTLVRELRSYRSSTIQGRYLPAYD